MRVISRRAIREFALQWPDAASSLKHWANTVEASVWNNPADVRRAANTVDFVQDLAVFNIGGNKYRLIAFIHYLRRAVYIKHILTHKEYGRGAWKQ